MEETSPSINKTIQEIQEGISNRTIPPLALMEKLQEFISEYIPCSIFSDYHSGGTNWNKGADFYNHITRILIQGGYHHIAHVILQDLWTKMNKEQQATGNKYPLALPSDNLTGIFLAVGEPGLAYRWSLLTYIHDVMNGLSRGAAIHYLRAILGVSKEAASIIQEIATECASEVESNWAEPCGFPEEALRRFILHEYGVNTHSDLVAHHTAKSEFPLSQGYLSAMLQTMDNMPKINTNARGEWLERIVCYLTSLLPGCVPKTKLLTETMPLKTTY